jgi:hypothetical protein
MAVWAAD